MSVSELEDCHPELVEGSSEAYIKLTYFALARFLTQFEMTVRQQ